MNAREEKELLNIVRNGKDDQLPDLKWTSPSATIAVFMSGKVFFDEESAFKFFNERKHLRHEDQATLEDFKIFFFNLERSPVVITKVYLERALKREVSVPEMGRRVQQATKSWFSE